MFACAHACEFMCDTGAADNFNGLFDDEECHKLQSRLDEKSTQLKELKRDAKGTRRKKCQECLNKVQACSDKLSDEVHDRFYCRKMEVETIELQEIL